MKSSTAERSTGNATTDHSDTSVSSTGRGLNKDKSDFLVLELKRDRASDVVVGQTLRYIGWVQEHLCSPAQLVNGCIIAHAQDERLQYALNQVPNMRFMKYEVDFRLIG